MAELTAEQVHRSSKWKELSRLARARQPWCSACGDDDEDKLQGDHIVPLDQGGAPYDGRNIDVLCGPCNRGKGATRFAGETLEGRGGLVPAVPEPSESLGEGSRPSLSPYHPPYQKPTTIKQRSAVK